MLHSDNTSLTWLQGWPLIPRRATRRPAAFATIVASIDSFVPSANDVIIFGLCPTESANAFCVSGVRCGSMKPLMFPTSTGRMPIVLTYRRRFIDHTRLVAIRVRENHACFVCPDLEQRAHGRVELGVDENDMLADVGSLRGRPGRRTPPRRSTPRSRRSPRPDRAQRDQPRRRARRPRRPPPRPRRPRPSRRTRDPTPGRGPRHGSTYGWRSPRAARRPRGPRGRRSRGPCSPLRQSRCAPAPRPRLAGQEPDRE